MRPKLLLAVVCWSLATLASPSLAAGAGTQAENPIAALMAPAGCSALGFGTPEPLFLTTCTIQLECANSSVISCTGNTPCSTGGAYDNCVFCSGSQQACCPGVTCCQVCNQQEADCNANCASELECNWCDRNYGICASHCTGGCVGLYVPH